MKTITSLNDLIQKLSNDENYKFSQLSTKLHLRIASLLTSTTVSNINYHYGCIYGIIETLYYVDYITEDEKDALCTELSNIKDGNIKKYNSHIMKDGKVGDLLCRLMNI